MHLNPDIDNHARTPQLEFFQAGCPSCCPTNRSKQRRQKH